MKPCITVSTDGQTMKIRSVLKDGTVRLFAFTLGKYAGAGPVCTRAHKIVGQIADLMSYITNLPVDDIKLSHNPFVCGIEDAGAIDGLIAQSKLEDVVQSMIDILTNVATIDSYELRVDAVLLALADQAKQLAASKIAETPKKIGTKLVLAEMPAETRAEAKRKLRELQIHDAKTLIQDLIKRNHRRS